MATQVTKLLARAQSAARRGARADAAQLYTEVLARFPANRRARQGLAQLERPDPAARAVTQAEIDDVLRLHRAGQHEKALAQARALSRVAPGMRALGDIRAACHRALGRPDRALEIYRDALQGSPRDARLWRNCGAALLDMTRLDEAEDCLAKAARLAPDDPDGWTALAEARLRRGHPRPAFDVVNRALAEHDSHAGALNLLGRTLRELGDLDMAAQAHRRALAATRDTRDTPRRAEAHLSLGVIAAARGQSAPARAAYRRAMALHPRNMQAHLNFSHLHDYTADDPHLAQLRQLARQDGDMPLADRARLHFALFNALDQITPGSDTAFDCLERGNSLRRAALRHDPHRDAALFAWLGRMAEGLPRNTVPPPAGTPRPVFIVGLPRSGTTLTERMLAAAPGAHGAGELPVADNAALALLRALRRDGRDRPALSDLADMAKTIRAELALYAPGARVIVDKLPLNFRWTALLLAALPEARIIHVTRDAVETCWSNFRTCYAAAGNGFAYGLDDLARYHGLATAHMARVHAQNDPRLTRLAYESLVAAPREEMRRVVDFCGLEWADACLAPERNARPVLTASARQARRPLYDGNQRGWQRYEARLAPLLAGLART
ncbi:MAG: sulfotransferase [Roseovarius sp.]|nr:sulfotransferase [Roseovarius sp.]